MRGDATLARVIDVMSALSDAYLAIAEFTSSREDRGKVRRY
jgi:hypothetical protein